MRSCVLFRSCVLILFAKALATLLACGVDTSEAGGGGRFEFEHEIPNAI